MHRMKIVHRDLKSANCLVNKHMTVKICDFGLSRVMTDTPIRDSSSAGTPEWMAPELIRNEPFTEKCDIFSLGVIMWELCTLNRPWEGVPPERVCRAHFTSEFYVFFSLGQLHDRIMCSFRTFSRFIIYVSLFSIRTPFFHSPILLFPIFLQFDL